ncbi:Methionyl-tRNA formyltransferase [Cytospora paraplurivora]|uniref:methionyl-tRNA formyltransferase n=1 Tax=Cytospora paraplurivora TaxID=2898453 RepID=A0AAN9YJE9_9PEZI
MPPSILPRRAFWAQPRISISIHSRNNQPPCTIQIRSNSTSSTTTTPESSQEDNRPIEDVETNEDANEDANKPATKSRSRRSRPFIHYPRRSDPLRILFCGSDDFSCASLRALYDLQQSDPKGKLIKSIDVLVRPGKPAGRGLRRVAVGPLFHLAEELGLPIHRRDTFTGWELPPAGHITHEVTGEVVKHRAAHQNSHRQPFNLIVAVSFGLFVPPRILGSLKYGGVNVHPSVLPDLRGPAPIQHAILRGRAAAGATLQTLHHKDFDRGDVLAQTRYPPGIPVPEGCDARRLHDILAAEGARLLVAGLRARLHVPPYNEDGQAGWRPDADDVARGLVRDAPKVRKSDAEVDWACWTWGRDEGLYPGGQGGWTAADLDRRFRAVGVKLAGDGGGGGGLWTRAITVKAPGEKRVIFEDVRAVPCPDQLRDVVLSIAEANAAKVAGKPVRWLTGKTGEDLIPQEISSAVFSQVRQDGAHEVREFRLPYMVDGTAIILPIKIKYAMIDGVVSPTVERDYVDALRIETIKVEGSKSRPAAHAMVEFREDNLTRRDISSLDFAMGIITSLVE